MHEKVLFYSALSKHNMEINWRPKPKLLTETRSRFDPIWADCSTFDDHIYPWFGFTVATQSYNCNEWLPSHFCTSGLQILLQTIIHFYGHMSFQITSECDTLIYFLYFMLNWSAFTRRPQDCSMDSKVIRIFSIVGIYCSEATLLLNMYFQINMINLILLSTTINIYFCQED